MKFINYLNEEIVYSSSKHDEIIQELSINCKPYINLLKANNISPFYRGQKIYGNDTFYKKSTRQVRRPHGTESSVFKLLNRWLQKNKHVRRDKNVAICSSGNPHILSLFGNVFYCFPYGPIHYTYIKTHDLNLNYNLYNTIKFNLIDLTKGLATADSIKLNAAIEKFFVTDSNIKEAHTNQYEIWFKCDEYGLVSRKFASDSDIIFAALGIKK